MTLGGFLLKGTRGAFRLAALAGAVSIGLLITVRGEERERSAAELMDVLIWNREPIGGPFALVDQDGAKRTEADFRGKLMLVYFGFTYCPDICPTDLQEISQAVELLGSAADDVQPVFVTVDPARDTPDHLKTYLSLFHPRLVGLTGSMDEIKRAAAAYKAYFRRVETPGGYTVDHSAHVYLMGRDGAYLGFFPPNTPAERMAETIRLHLREKR